MHRWISRIVGRYRSDGRLARRRLIGLLSIIGIVGTSLAGFVGPAAHAQVDDHDLYNFLSSFELGDDNGSVFSIDSTGTATCSDGSNPCQPTLTAGQDYTMSLTFKELPPPDEFQSPMTYNFPAGVSVLDYPTPTPVTDNNGVSVGTFTIVNNVLIFTQDPNYQGDFWTAANSMFTIIAHGSFDNPASGQEDTIYVDFGTDIKPGILVQPGSGSVSVAKYSQLPGSSTPDYDILSKTALKSDLASNYNPATHMAHFDVVVTADPNGGPITLDSVQDDANFNNQDALWLDDSSLVVTLVAADGTSTVLDPSSYTITPTSWSGTGTGGTSYYFEFSPAVTMNPGDRLLIDYQMQVSDAYLASLYDSGQTSYSGTAYNYTTVTAHDTAGTKLQPSADAYNWLVAGTIVSKSVNSSAPAYPGYAAWTATVGDGYYPLGTGVSDSVQSGTFTDLYPFTVDVYGLVNGQLVKLGTETFHPAAGNRTATFTSASAEVSGSDNSSITWNYGLSSFTYSAPTGLTYGGQPVTVTKAVFNYYTTAASVSSGNPVGTTGNQTCLQTTGANSFKACAGAQSSVSPWQITKTVSLQTDAKGAYYLYTILAAVPKEFYNESFSLDDTLALTGWQPMYYADNTVASGGAPQLNLDKLLTQDDLTVNVYDLRQDHMPSDISWWTIDDPISWIPDYTQLNKVTAFNPSKPAVAATPTYVSGTRIADGSITATGSWNIMPTSWSAPSTWGLGAGGYSSNKWTMTFGSSSVAPATYSTGTQSYDTSTSTWPVDVDSLLAVTYKVYTDRPLFNNTNGQWLDGSGNFNSWGNTITNMATMSSGDQSKAIQVSISGETMKRSGPSWSTTTSSLNTPPDVGRDAGTLGAAMINQPGYFAYDGQYYFPYSVWFRWPRDTTLAQAPTITDTYDPNLTFDPNDPNTYVYLTVHDQPLMNGDYGWASYPATFDLLIKVPLSAITADAANHTLAVDLNAVDNLASCPTILYERSGASLFDSSTYDPDDIIKNGASDYFDTPRDAYQALLDLLVADPRVGAGNADADVMKSMAQQWYNLNSPMYGAITTAAGPVPADTSVNYGSGTSAGFYTLDYLLTFPDGQIPDSLNNSAGTASLNNTADLSFTTGTGTGHFPQSATTKFQSKFIGKSINTTGATYNAGTVVDVNVNLNPYGISILSGMLNAGPVFEAVDQMTNMTFASNSLVVYSINPPQGEKDIAFDSTGAAASVVAPTTLANYKTSPSATSHTMQELTYAQMYDLQQNMPVSGTAETAYAYTYYVDSAGQFGPAGDVYLYLPDGQQYEVDYQAIVDADTGETVNLTNAVSVKGLAYDFTADREGIKILGTSGSGSSSHQTMELKKVDGFTSTPLENGVFALYGPQARRTPDVPPTSLTVGGTDYTVTSNDALPPGPVASAGTPTLNVPATIQVDGHTYYFLQMQTTGSDGTATFSHSLLLATLEWTYVMAEVLPPTGYAAIPAPIEFALNGATVNDPNVQVLPDVNNELLVADAPTGGPRLPDTGGPGDTGFIVLGLLLLSVSGVALLWGRRREWAGDRT